MRSLAYLIKKLHFWRISGLLAADLLLFGTTDPGTVPSYLLIVGFILMSATLYYLLDGLLALARLYGFPIRRRRRVLRALALSLSGVLALQSIGQLSVKDVLILAPLTALAYFYLTKHKPVVASSQSV